MINNYNKQLRRILVNNINSISYYLGMNIDTAILYYTELLYEIFDTNNDFTKILKTYISELIYADAYKVNSYIHQKLLSNHMQINNYNELNNIVDHGDLLAIVSADPSFFADLLKNSYLFTEQNGLSKILMIKSLSKNDNEKILEIAPIHALDIQTYDKNITIQDLIKNYQNQNKLYNNELDINFDEGKIETLYGFIKELSLLDPNNTKELLRKIYQIDNKISLYLKDKVIYSDIIDQHIETYKQNEEKIIETLLHDKDFLIDALWMVIDSCINHYYNDIKLDEKLTYDILSLKKN